jgi:FkbM family methyltransferase
MGVFRSTRRAIRRLSKRASRITARGRKTVRHTRLGVAKWTRHSRPKLANLVHQQQLAPAAWSAQQASARSSQSSGYSAAVEIVDTDLECGVTAKMFCVHPRTVKRSLAAFEKEPETIRWLDRAGPDDVLWDVGAHIGAFTLYAALRRHCRVVAFEPAAASFFTLNRNIELNDLQDSVIALCTAIPRERSIDYLHMPETHPGASLSNFGEATNFQNRAFRPAFRQGAVAYSLDDLAKATVLPFPTHMKIDVDGLERDIVLGGGTVLADHRLRSVVIELDIAPPVLIKEVARLLQRHGLICTDRGERFGDRNVTNAQFDRASDMAADGLELGG